MKRPAKVTNELKLAIVAFCKTETITAAVPHFRLGYRTISNVLKNAGVSVPKGYRSKNPDRLPMTKDLTPEERRRRHAANAAQWRKAHPEKYREIHRRYQKNNLEKVHERTNKWHRENKEKRRQWKERTKEKRRATHLRWVAKNKIKNRKYQREYSRTDRRKATQKAWRRKMRGDPANRLRYLLKGTRHRCRASGVFFAEDLCTTLKPPTHCLCCGCLLEYSKTASRDRFRRTLSLDRVDPRGDYTVKNVRLICMRCNIAKNDASLEELKLLVTYVERELTTDKQPDTSDKKSNPDHATPKGVT